jgi:hypothetical protein
MKTTTGMKKITIRRAGDVKLTSACGCYRPGA